MMKKAGTRNPVFMLDEVDKMSMDFRGDPSAALLEVLDPEQNYMFVDHYLDVEYDLSQVFFICTANVLHTIPPALQDRMEVIRLSGYTELEKAGDRQAFSGEEADGAGRSHRQADPVRRRRAGHVDSALHARGRRAKPGARDRQRLPQGGPRGGRAGRKTARLWSCRSWCAAETVPEYLGPLKFRELMAEKKNDIGAAVGLAWTEVGGQILTTEATIMDGKGKLTITGKLGDVMQESAHAAMSYIRSRAQSLGLPRDFYRHLDIHVHVPEGAIPKDGPSAGITIATTICSALSRIPVRHDVAMTGEITLRGRVLPIGGLKEKLLAAHRHGIREAILPRDNEKDLPDIPETIRKDMKLHFVDSMDEVLKIALEREIEALPLTPVAPQVEAAAQHSEEKLH